MLQARRAFPRERLLARIAGDLRALFPDRVERLVLYGSRARGDARDEGLVEDSDWDIALFLREGPTAEDRKALASWWLDLLEETGHYVQPFAFPGQAYERRTIFMHELRRDAVDL